MRLGGGAVQTEAWSAAAQVQEETPFAVGSPVLNQVFMSTERMPVASSRDVGSIYPAVHGDELPSRVCEAVNEPFS